MSKERLVPGRGRCYACGQDCGDICPVVEKEQALNKAMFFGGVVIAAGFILSLLIKLF